MNPLDLWNKLDDKGILDAPAPGMYLRGLLENLNPFDPSTATERILPEAEKETLQRIVKDQVKKGKAGLSYSDFITKEEGAEALGYKAGIADLTDPRESLRMLLGRADITKDEDGNLYVEDVFDFNAPEEEKNASLLDRVRMAYNDITEKDMSLYGGVHRIGELFAEPIPVKIKVGNAEELGLSKKQLSKIPMYREYVDINERTIK